MKTAKIFQVSAWALTGLLVSGALAYAKSSKDCSGCGDKREARMEKHMKKMEKDLGLSADQSKQLEDGRKARREESKKLFAQMEEKRRALQDELKKPDFKEETVMGLQADVNDLQNKMSSQRLNALLADRKIMTPEQFAKYQEMLEKGWKKHGRGGRWGKQDGGKEHKETGESVK